MIGRSIGNCEVIREMGRGGMGVVYLAHGTKLDRDVAIKVLPESLARDKDRELRWSNRLTALC